MITFSNILIDGLAYGMVLFVIAVGLSVTLGLMRFVNLSHGAFAMVGGYCVALLTRELMLLVMVGILRRHGYPPPQVNFLGKAATFNLMYAFPLLLLSDGTGWLSSLAEVFGWAFAGWGTTLYWWAGILYVVQVRRLVKTDTEAD